MFIDLDSLRSWAMFIFACGGAVLYALHCIAGVQRVQRMIERATRGKRPHEISDAPERILRMHEFIQRGHPMGYMMVLGALTRRHGTLEDGSGCKVVTLDAEDVAVLAAGNGPDRLLIHQVPNRPSEVYVVLGTAPKIERRLKAMGLPSPPWPDEDFDG